MNNQYQTKIGLEIHVQLKTKSKMFCACDNVIDEKEPNINICPICLGYPGVLPAANRQAIEWTIKTGLALNCQIPKISKFDRKHYYYPDLPKNYQISQFDHPFCLNGFLEILDGDVDYKINIRRIHLEEDAAKLIHRDGESLIDFNRVGTPLMEIVTEPDIESPKQAKIFLQKLRTILRYLGVSDANMEKGELRCDANISINQKSKIKNQKLGTPVEIKNLNSFKMVEKALLFEEKRQRELIKKGEKIIKETRGWDQENHKTISQRSKEEASDYRYFPEPDIPPFVFSDKDIEKIRKTIESMPEQFYQNLIANYQISAQEAKKITQNINLKDYFSKIVEISNGDSNIVRTSAKWLVNKFYSKNIKPRIYLDFIQKIDNGFIPQARGIEILKELSESKKLIDAILKEKKINGIIDNEDLLRSVRLVIKENPKAVIDFQKGKLGALKFLIGQTMRKTLGQADPLEIEKIVQKELKNG
jgi:aspartyl-tRNA(Asn)/glutamyl-tRNA(Gln) amidotransferase subunit B